MVRLLPGPARAVHLDPKLPFHRGEAPARESPVVSPSLSAVRNTRPGSQLRRKRVSGFSVHSFFVASVSHRKFQPWHGIEVPARVFLGVSAR